MTPPKREAYGTPVSSVTGSASMSPRSSTDGRMPSRFPPAPMPSAGPAPPRSTAVTELSFRPVLTSSGRLSSAASTFSRVSGRLSPISGSR